MKVGLIRCRQTEDMCPASTCIQVMKRKDEAFADVEDEIDLVGITTCGGCPGKRAVIRAEEMVARGADTIVFASCITKGNPIGFPCPFARQMMRAVKRALPKDIHMVDYTHE